MPLDKSQILSFLRTNSSLFSNQYNVRRIGLFGSYVHDKQKPDSDIDIIVEGDNISDDDLKVFFERKFDKKVDIVKEDSLFHFMRYIIHKETEYV